MYLKTYAKLSKERWCTCNLSITFLFSTPHGVTSVPRFIRIKERLLGQVLQERQREEVVDPLVWWLGMKPLLPTLPRRGPRRNQLSSLRFESDSLFQKTFFSPLAAIHLRTGPAAREHHWAGGAATSGSGAHPGATAVSQHHRGAQVQAGRPQGRAGRKL